jgi:hypothetical protein
MKKTILIGLLLVLFGQVFGQEGPNVVVFNSPENDKEQLDLKTLVKFGMLEPFAGSFTFYFERVITENFTAEVGLGMTLENYFNLALDGNLGNLGSGSYVSGLGPVFNLGLRYYPEFAPEYFYVAPEFRIKNYNAKEYRTISGEETEFKTFVRNTSGRLTFGYQDFVSKNVFWDFYGGFGVTGRNTGILESSVTTDPLTGISTTNYFIDEDKGFYPTLHVGIKLGLGFE